MVKYKNGTIKIKTNATIRIFTFTCMSVSSSGESESGIEKRKKLMADDYFKFPRTRHIFDAGGGGVTRDDLVMCKKEAAAFLKGRKLIIEEKVDGANLGISVTSDYQIKLQNRSHYVNSSTHRQFSALDSWVEKHSRDIYAILEPTRHILFGEWLLAKHSIYYEKLPDYFLAFDIYDKQKQCFLSVDERDSLLCQTELSCVRKIAELEDAITTELVPLLETKSKYYDGFVEGLVMKIADVTEDSRRDFFLHRTKLVRPDFLQGIEEQWTKQKLVKNRLLCY